VPDDYFGDASAGYAWFASESGGRTDGYVYLGGADMADRTRYVWWIVVDPTTQGRGVGKELLRFAEDEARRRGGRVMFIETSGLLFDEPTRRFYLKTGQQHSYYPAAGDHSKSASVEGCTARKS
jgi:GNAT superfamily N-acetyltransferase